MTILSKVKQILFTSGLSKENYQLVADKIHEDNRQKLGTVCYITFLCLVIMLIMSLLVESISHSRTVYTVAALTVLLLSLFSKLGKRHHYWSNAGIYLFSSLAFTFGIVQSVVTSPEEQTASFMALILAIPFWFGMRPLHMISCICMFTGLFIACVLRYKTGYVQTADIVNALIYSSSSIIISTYASCIKVKRFFAEYLTDRMGKLDMLTRLGNRNAYTEYTNRYLTTKMPDDLTFIYMDVNELKITNDSLGHHAGDELLCGAADCIQTVFGDVATCYRTGGDEFVVVGRIEKPKLDELCRQFERTVDEWKGSWGRPLRISYGCASAGELPGAELNQVLRLADSRLYEAKTLYYSTKGLDRRGHQEAYSALCESYIKILRVDLTNDTCKVIRAEANDPAQAGSSECFSRWMELFGQSGHVHADDVEEYHRKTQLNFLRDYFRSGKPNIHIFYRRKIGDKFGAVMAELMTAREYTHEQQIVFLYVKNIDR